MKLAIPKGRMFDNVVQLLTQGGLDPARVLRPSIRGLVGWSVKLLKPRDCLRMLQLGVRDVAFAGKDLIEEMGITNAVVVLDTGLDPVRIVAATQAALLARDQRTLLPRERGRPLRIATEYPNLAARWIRERGLQASIVHTSGATEVFPPEDADIIVDNTSTGTTLRANGLVTFDTIATSSTCLVANASAYGDAGKRAQIDMLALMLQSVISARDMVLMDFNVPGHVTVDAALRKCGLKGLLTPTVSPLLGGGSAVKVAVRKTLVPQLLATIRRAGGSDILVSDIHHLVR